MRKIVLMESTTPAGKQKYSFNISHLPVNDNYLIKTTTPEGTDVQKIMKN